MVNSTVSSDAWFDGVEHTTKAEMAMTTSFSTIFTFNV